MLTTRRPTESDVTSYLISRKTSELTYELPGITASLNVSNQFDVDRQQILLGFGEQVFNLAKQAIGDWAMFPTPLTELYWPDRAIYVGAEVAVLFRAGPLWSLNPCRIAYVVDESSEAGSIERFGFAYGTLGGHLECGEERFTVSWNRKDDSVSYELIAVSRPNHLLTRIGYVYARIVQARFRRESAAAIKQYVDTQMSASAHQAALPCDSTSL